LDIDPYHGATLPRDPEVHLVWKLLSIDFHDFRRDEVSTSREDALPIRERAEDAHKIRGVRVAGFVKTPVNASFVCDATILPVGAEVNLLSPLRSPSDALAVALHESIALWGTAARASLDGVAIYGIVKMRYAAPDPFDENVFVSLSFAPEHSPTAPKKAQ